MRERNRAGRNTKTNKPKADVNRPQAAGQREYPKDREPDFSFPRTVLSNAPTPTSQSEAQYTDKSKHDSNRIVRAFIAVGYPFRFLDRHAGSITAVATVVIGLLTYWYATYSKRQWEAMVLGMNVAQRPWIKVHQSKEGDIQLSAGKPILDAATYENVGNAPVIKLRMKYSIEVVPIQNAPQFNLTGSSHVESGWDLILPKDPFPLFLSRIDNSGGYEVLTDKEFLAVSRYESITLEFISMTYDDTLGVHHAQSWCNWIDPPGTFLARDTRQLAYLRCMEYNKADSNHYYQDTEQ
jgi:hypothetical protein